VNEGRRRRQQQEQVDDRSQQQLHGAVQGERVISFVRCSNVKYCGSGRGVSYLAEKARFKRGSNEEEIMVVLYCEASNDLLSTGTRTRTPQTDRVQRIHVLV